MTVSPMHELLNPLRVDSPDFEKVDNYVSHPRYQGSNATNVPSIELSGMW